MKAGRGTILSFLFIIIALGLLWPGVVSAEAHSQTNDQELAEMYAPVLYFHPAELFRPQPVEVLVDTARLRQSESSWYGAVNVLLEVSIRDLISFRDQSYSLDAWYGDSGASDYKNYSAHRAYYQAVLSPEAGGPPIVTYARVSRNQPTGEITIQYWLFYYYNDWFNKHEGDWEMVQVVLNPDQSPHSVVLAQHRGGTQRLWENVQVEADTHPAVYVALGSHASYFWGDEIYPNGQDIGNLRIEIMDRTGTEGRGIPDVILLPEREQVQAAPELWPNLEWLLFGGYWGEQAFQSDFGGPLGPADKGEQWEQPYDWGAAQPLDSDIWYKNRLRVEVSGPGAAGAKVNLNTSDGRLLPFAEQAANPAILHNEPPPEGALAMISLLSGQAFSLTAVWPDIESAAVTSYYFADLPASPTGQAELYLSDSGAMVTIPDVGEFVPTSSETSPVTWDAADIVWLTGLMPASDVARGIAISLLAGLLPTLLYVLILYWADRYEKEPKRLLAAAFFWGALPALVVAVVVRIFFQLPAELLGANAIEVVRLGLVTPLIEEALKGIAVIYIARRFRLEFDNLLDGLIYGAMVGFGFAMTANTISYLGAFLLRGFAGLNNTIFVQGVLFGFNQAFYTAIFGAGLGYARLARPTQRTRRISPLLSRIPVLAFALAVLANALHNLALNNSLGLGILTITATWVGIVFMLAAIVWSLRRQWWVIAVYLPGEVPDGLYHSLTSLRRRTWVKMAALLRRDLSAYRYHSSLQQLSSELAFKKMQLQRFPGDGEVLAEIVRLRAALGELVGKD